MKSRLLTRIAALITVALLIAAVLIVVHIYRNRLNGSINAIGSGTGSARAQTVSNETPEGIVQGPFSLRTVTYKSGVQTFLSFSVYYLHEGSEELWYACGRMFPAADVASIAWANAQFDIAVTLKDGRQELFSYDGNNQWQ